MTIRNNSQNDLLSSIAKISGANLHRSNFTWKPEFNWNQKEGLYMAHAMKRRRGSIERSSAIAHSFSKKTIDSCLLKYILEYQDQPAGWGEVHLFRSSFTQGFVFSSLEMPADTDKLKQTQENAFSFLLSMTFLLGGCDWLRFFSHSTGYRRQCHEKQGQILSFEPSQNKHLPQMVGYIEITRVDWMKDGPGSKHEAALLHLLPIEPKNEHLATKKPTTSFSINLIRKWRGLR